MHATAQLLIDVVLQMLEERPVDQITVDQVLAVSKVSRSSLYHHFEDYPDLVEHAIAARVATLNLSAAEAVRWLLDTTAEPDEFRAQVIALTRLNHAQDRAPFRMTRTVAFAMTDRNERFRATLARHQQAVTDVYVELISAGQERGWVDTTLDPASVAVMLQAITLGRVVDDVSERPVDPEAWIRTAETAVARMLFPRT